MGTPVPDNSETIPCLNCWGADKPFGTFPTPLFISVVIEGVVHGPTWVPADGEALNGEHVLQQEVGFPCAFVKLIPPFGQILVAFPDGQMICNCINENSRQFFVDLEVPGCRLDLVNQLVDRFIDGIMTVDIGS